MGLQAGIDPSHILYFGRKDNFWEMAETGPCGPCSEIHVDRGESFCNRKDQPGHICRVNGDCSRFLELWNLVFIQYNRSSPNDLTPLPARHVDTGMGFERIVSVLQDVDSNYKTDLLLPLMDAVLELNGQNESERQRNLTPYRVIADHCRASTFLIADGVVPGNIGRNYICRMIIRRASRFGSKIGLEKPFLGKIAEKVVEIYGEAYPDLRKNKKTIIDNLTREEKKFHSTVEGGLSILETYMNDFEKSESKTLSGDVAFDLYATHGLPLEITKDVLSESGFNVDESGFFDAMEEHRVNSGAGKEFGALGGEDADFYAGIFADLVDRKLLPEDGVTQDPYHSTEIETEIVSIISNGKVIDSITADMEAEIILKDTNFYLESGGQVSDSGTISSEDFENLFFIKDLHKPASGIIVHLGEMEQGSLSVGSKVKLSIDKRRRQDIMRNHTATHLLQHELRKVLGDHVRQAGSLVAPDRLRFDFTHPDALSAEESRIIEDGINQNILDNSDVTVSHKKLDQALEEGATALFGEKYGDDVRTISIGGKNVFSYELCGGTHVPETGEIGTFLIISEGSAAAGIRRIEAVTGRKSYEVIEKRLSNLKSIANSLETPLGKVPEAIEALLEEKKEIIEKLSKLMQKEAISEYHMQKEKVQSEDGVSTMEMFFNEIPLNVLRQLADEFRNDFDDGIALFGNLESEGKVQFIITAADKIVKQGLHAGNIAKKIAEEIGGSGGGRPNMAQAGGRDFEKLKSVKLRDYLAK